MSKLALKIATLIVLLIVIIVYGTKLFRSLTYNKKILETDIYEYIPEEASYVVNFSRNHYFEEYFELDTVNSFLIKQIKGHITYPLIVIKKKGEEDILLTRTTLMQEVEIEKILRDTIAPYQSPKKIIDGDAKIYYYPLPENKLIAIMFNEGVCAISTNYQKINQLIDIDKANLKNLMKRNDEQANLYIRKTYTNSPVSIFIESEGTFYSLSYANNQDITIEGKYFGSLEQDSLKLSYNEMNNLLNINTYYTDSIQWSENNQLKVWLNKAK